MGLGTLLLAFVIVPVYFASRPLRGGETREGGTAWNVLRNFAITWTLIMAVVTVMSLFSAADAVGPLQSDAEKAGAGIGMMLGMMILGAFWFFPMVGAVVLGFILRKSSVVERGPTGPLAVPDTSPVAVA